MINEAMELFNKKKINKKTVFKHESLQKVAQCLHRMATAKEVDFIPAAEVLMIATDIFSYKIDALYELVNQTVKGMFQNWS